MSKSFPDEGVGLIILHIPYAIYGASVFLGYSSLFFIEVIGPQIRIKVPVGLFFCVALPTSPLSEL